jgi:intradiol ring-cleaving dioxygenase-like protein
MRGPRLSANSLALRRSSDAPRSPSRRQILRSALVSSGLSLAIGYPALTFAQSAAPTPQCHDPDEATIRQTEGYAGFRYRGHLFTDGEGRYRFRTILPALYPGRTRHYHIKVQAPDRPVLTTQLYFPDESANRSDGLIRRDLAMRITEAPDGLAARFDFVLDMR